MPAAGVIGAVTLANPVEPPHGSIDHYENNSQNSTQYKSKNMT